MVKIEILALNLNVEIENLKYLLDQTSSWSTDDVVDLVYAYFFTWQCQRITNRRELQA